MAEINLETRIDLLLFTPDEVDKILAQFNRNKENIIEDIKSIRTWFKQQPHLPDFLRNEQILMFLLWQKFSIEKTKRAIDLSFTVKTLFPEYYGDAVLTDGVRRVHEAINVATLPKLSENLKRVTLVTLSGKDDWEINYLAGYIVLFAEMRCLMDISDGDEYIGDCANLTPQIAAKVGFKDVRNLLFIGEKIYGTRCYALNLINVPPFIEPIIRFVKGIVKPKLRNRLRIIKKEEDLFKYYSKDMIPVDYGGTEKSVSEIKSEWWELFKTKEDYFKQARSSLVDENLRPEKLENHEYMGFHGNFRKLDID